MLLACYAIGSLHAAYFMGRIFAKIDIREHGSGNSGGINVIRVMGTFAGVPVVIFDVGKVVLIVMFVNYMFYGQAFGLAHYQLLPGSFAAFGAVLGHIFPPYLKFKGGKGIAPTLGFAFALDWRIALICIAVWIILVLLTKYITVGGVSGIAVFAASSLWLFSDNLILAAVCLAISIIVIAKHKQNIILVIKGKEMKITERKKGGELNRPVR